MTIIFFFRLLSPGWWNKTEADLRAASLAKFAIFLSSPSGYTSTFSSSAPWTPLTDFNLQKEVAIWTLLLSRNQLKFAVSFPSAETTASWPFSSLIR